MNAGKSTTLLQSAFNYEEMNMNVLIYLPSIVQQDVIKSRIGLQRRAVVFDSEYDFTTRHTNINCVFVDEAQFLTRKQVLQLACLVDTHGIPVLCYGLRTDFKGNLFEGSQYLLALADELNEIKTICYCGSKATMNVRVNDKNDIIRTGEQIEIGGNERYQSRCRSCYYATM